MSTKDLLGGLERSLEAESAAVEQRFDDAERFTRAEARRLPRSDHSTERERSTVRDTFSFPSSDHQLLAKLQARCFTAGFNASKSEIVRAGLHGLMNMAPETFVRTLSSLKKLKPGPRRRR